MQVKMKTVDIRRSELSVIRVTVPAWEFPILAALHGPVNVTPVTDSMVEGEPPQADAEFQRLTTRYPRERRDDGSQGNPIAENVYGQHAAGVMNLQRQIDAAVVA